MNNPIGLTDVKQTSICGKTLIYYVDIAVKSIFLATVMPFRLLHNLEGLLVYKISRF